MCFLSPIEPYLHDKNTCLLCRSLTMIPGNVDPRRPDKVQRYKPPASGNGNAPGEDLTPDYMNILGMYCCYMSVMCFELYFKPW